MVTWNYSILVNHLQYLAEQTSLKCLAIRFLLPRDAYPGFFSKDEDLEAYQELSNNTDLSFHIFWPMIRSGQSVHEMADVGKVNGWRDGSMLSPSTEESDGYVMNNYAMYQDEPWYGG